MDLEDTGSKAKFMIRDRDSKFTAAFDTVLHDAGLRVVLPGIRMPRMNSIMERWGCRPVGTSSWTARSSGTSATSCTPSASFEHFYTEHRPHRTLRAAAPLRPLPEPITDPRRIAYLDVRRRDRLGGALHSTDMLPDQHG